MSEPEKKPVLRGVEGGDACCCGCFLGLMAGCLVFTASGGDRDATAWCVFFVFLAAWLR